MDFTSAHDRYLPLIHYLVASYPDRYRDDLVQEGLWGLYLGCCAYDPARGTPFDAYIKVCIRNRVYSAARGYASDVNLVPLDDLGDFLSSTEDSLTERFVEHDALRTAVRDLKPRLSSLERQVLERYLSGQSGSAIAESLGISSKSADNAMTRIKKKIREHLPY